MIHYGLAEAPMRVKCSWNMKPTELRRAGLKVTHPRMRILQIFDQPDGKHVTAEDIYTKLLEHQDDIGLATVYRVLTQFEAAGIILKHNFEGGQAVYELDRGKHHDHMIDIGQRQGHRVRQRGDRAPAARNRREARLHDRGRTASCCTSDPSRARARPEPTHVALCGLLAQGTA